MAVVKVGGSPLSSEVKLILKKRVDDYFLLARTENSESVVGTLEEDEFSYLLSLSNCKAIEHGYDLDELADEYSDVFDAFTDDRFDAFKAGFQKCLELIGNKKFTEEDMKSFARNYYREIRENTSNLLWEDLADKCMKEHIQSIQQTEWEVEILTEPMNLDEIRQQGKGFLHSETRKIKFDYLGRITLKRK